MNDGMKTSIIGLQLIRDSEGLRLTAYPDPATGGEPWTVGYGHTGGVQPGQTITLQEAENWLLDDVEACEEVIRHWVAEPLTQGMWDACVDFIFNIGPGQQGERDGFVWLRSGNHSSLLRYINAGNYTLAADEFPKWANPPLPGLVTRRSKERELFLSQGVDV